MNPRLTSIENLKHEDERISLEDLCFIFFLIDVLFINALLIIESISFFLKPFVV